MRKFSKLEKDIIITMIQKGLNDRNVLDLISDIVINKDRAIRIDFKNKALNIIHKSSDNSILTELIESIFLLKYLEKENLIFIHSNYQPPNPSGNFLTKPNGINENNLSQYKITSISTTIFDDIDKYKQSYFSCSTELIKHKENNFVTDDEIRHKEDIKIAKKSLEESKKGVKQAEKSVKQSRNAIIVSIVLGLLSIIVTFYLSNEQAKMETKINNEQFEIFNKQIESLSNAVISLDSSFIKVGIPDTIKAVIIKEKK